MPVEFQRKVRSLEDLSHWKGTEYRMFLHYIGIVALKNHLLQEAYTHFLILFSAVTICSSNMYIHFLDLARTMFNTYIEIFKSLYGVEYISSNVHNLCHLVDEVELYGALQTFSSYPFETFLGKIKRSLRNGNKPLEQAARRIIESNGTPTIFTESLKKYPILSKPNAGENVSSTYMSTHKVKYFCKIDFKTFVIITSATQGENNWILTKNKDIAYVINILSYDEHTTKFYCNILTKKCNFF